MVINKEEKQIRIEDKNEVFRAALFVFAYIHQFSITHISRTMYCKVYTFKHIILPFKAKRVYFDKNLKIFNSLLCTKYCITFYSASDDIILF